MAIDPWKGVPPDLMTNPAADAFDAYAAKDDDADLSIVTRAIYTGSGGDIKVTMLNGTAVTFTAVPAGMLLPVRIVRLWSTGTDATDVIGLV